MGETVINATDEVNHITITSELFPLKYDILFCIPKWYPDCPSIQIFWESVPKALF